MKHLKLVIAIVLACLLGCESDRIDTCGRACMWSGNRMDSYTAASGCRCVRPDAERAVVTAQDGGAK